MYSPSPIQPLGTRSVEEAAAWARVDGGSSLQSGGYGQQQQRRTGAVAPTLPRLLADIPRWSQELQKVRAQRLFTHTLSLACSTHMNNSTPTLQAYGKGGASKRKVLERILTEAGLLQPPPPTPVVGAEAAAAAVAAAAGTKKPPPNGGGKAGLTGLPRLVALVADAFEELPHLGAWCRAVRSNHLTLPPSVAQQYQPQQPGSHSQPQRKVVLSTMHGAKGQEFDLVFLAGWDEGVFPLLPRGGAGGKAGDSSSGSGSGSSKSKGRVKTGAAPAFATAAEEAAAVAEQEAAAARMLAEERRLAYVALTRARLNAYITFTHRRRLPGGAWATTTPSRFIAELPRRLVRLGLLGPRVLGRAPKPTNDADFRRIRPQGVKTRGDDLLVSGARGGGVLNSAVSKVDPLSLPRRPPSVPMSVPEPVPEPEPVPPANVAPQPQPLFEEEEPAAVGVESVVSVEALFTSMVETKEQQQLVQPQQQAQPPMVEAEAEVEEEGPVILVDAATAPRLATPAILAAAVGIATTAAMARGMALAGEETAVGRARRAGRMARLTASLKRVLPPTPVKERRKGTGSGKGGLEGYEVVPSLLSLLEGQGGNPAKVVALRPFYRACLQACGRRLANLPAREDPSTLLPLSQCPTQHLGLLAVAHLVSPQAGIVQREGWGALRTLFRRLLARYGFGGAGGVTGLKVPVARKQPGRNQKAKQQQAGKAAAAKAELRPLAQCSGSELADVLLALLAQEEGRLPSDEPVGNRRARGGGGKGKKTTTT